jgi:hypothetical protein
MMTPSCTPSKSLAAASLLVFAGLSGAGFLSGSENPMLTKKNRLAAIFETTKPVCFGRFIVDVPKTAEVVYGPARLPVEIWRKEGEGEGFDAAVKRAVNQSEAKRWLAYGPLIESTSMLGNVMEGIGPNHKIVFGVGRGVSEYYNVQSFVRAGPDLFLQEYEAFSEGDKYLKAVKDAKEIALRLRHRADDDIPDEPGICLDGAFVSEPHRYMVEAVSLGIRLKEFDEILIPSDALPPRLAAAEKNAFARGEGAWYLRIRILRKGERRAGGWDGFEVAAYKPAQKVEGESHEFLFMSQGEPKNPLLPVLDVQLHTGVSENRVGAVKPSISDDEALYLWDKILGSIRPRPVQQAATR